MAYGTILITQGTQTGIPIDTVSGTTYPISKLDVGTQGASSPWTGAVTVTSGSFNGTQIVSAGTVTTGTVDTVSQLPPNQFQANSTTGTTTLGTLKSGTAGSSVYITDLAIGVTVVTGTVSIFNGGTNSTIWGPYTFNANGGMVSNFRTPIKLNAGSDLTYSQTGTATVTVSVQGFVK